MSATILDAACHARYGGGPHCAYCARPSAGNYAVHRDGFGVGPEVPLCDACGSLPTPTLEDIWARIARP